MPKLTLGKTVALRRVTHQRTSTPKRSMVSINTSADSLVQVATEIRLGEPQTEDRRQKTDDSGQRAGEWERRTNGGEEKTE